MKKLLIIPILLLVSFFVKAQQCPTTTCTDSLAFNVTKDTLIVSPGYTSPVWKVVAGPGVLGTNVITGLQPGTTTVLVLNANSGNIATISTKVITVAPTPPVPVIPRTIVAAQIDGTGHLVVIYSDGGTQKL